MADMIQLTASPPDILTAYVNDTYGGKNILIQVSPMVVGNLQWLEQYRHRLAAEETLRNNNPMLKELYDSYQTVLKLLQT